MPISLADPHPGTVRWAEGHNRESAQVEVECAAGVEENNLTVITAREREAVLVRDWRSSSRNHTGRRASGESARNRRVSVACCDASEAAEAHSTRPEIQAVDGG